MEENLCPNLTPEINAPLSPVLTSNKKNRKIIRKIKLMNKIGVCTFESKSRTPSPLIDENSQTFNTETPENIVKFQKDTPNSELVERIRKINELKNTKKVFYDTTEDTQCTLSSITKPVDYESINTKYQNLVTEVPKIIEGSPKSPTKPPEATKDPIAKIEVPLRNFELPLDQKFNKFTSVSGKKIVISERSLSRATKIFDDIFLEQNGTLQNSNCILNQTLGDKIDSNFETIASKKVDLVQNFEGFKKSQNRTLEAKIGFDLENTKEKDFLAPKSVEIKFCKKGKGVTFSKTDDLNFTMDQNFDYLNKNLTQIINEKVGNETSENIQDLTLISRELENNPILSQESSKFSPYTPDEIEFKKPIFKNPSSKTKTQNFAPETQCVDPEFLGKLNFSQWIDSPKKNPNIDLFTQDDFVYCTEVAVDKIECDQMVFKGFDISEQDQIYEKLIFFKKFVEIFNSNQKKKILYPLSITFYDVKEKLEGRNYSLRHRKNSNGVVAPRRGRKRKRRSSVSATKVYGAQNLQSDELSSQNEDLPSQREKFSSQNEDFSSQNEDLPSQHEKFSSQNEDLSRQNEDLPSQNEDLPSQHEKFSSQNKGLLSQNEQFLKPNERFLGPNERFSCPNEKYLNQDQNFSQNERYFGENVEILNPNNENSNRNPKGPFSRTVKIDSEMIMGPNELKIGFSTASGKLLTVSTETMEKIENFFENIDFGNTESTFKELDPLEVRHPDNRTIKNSFVNQRETFEKSSIENSETENSETSVIATKSPEIDSKSSKRSKIGSKSPEMSSESSKLSQKSSEFNQNISQLSQESSDLSQKKFGFVKNDSDSSSQQFLELLPKSSSSSQKESNSQNSSSLSQKSKYAQDFLSSDSQNSQKDSEKSLESTQSASHFKQESNKSEFQNLSEKYSEPVPNNENKSSEGNFGFATASGKKIGLSKSALNKAQNIFKDLESFQHVSNNEDLNEEKISVANFGDRKNSSELEENISKIKSAEELFLETLENDFSQKDHQKVSFVLSPEKSSMVPPETSFGFSSASGKKLGLSETALKKAQNMFKDLDSLANFPTPEKSTRGPPDTNFGFSSASGKKQGLSETALKKAQNMFKDLDSLENVPTPEKSTRDPPQASFGFSSASGKKLGLSETALKKAQNMFKDLDSLENVPTPEKSTRDPPQASFGFSSASGKKLGLSETALKKAQNMFKDLDSLENVPTPEKSTRDPPQASFGFSSASEKKLGLSETALKKAQNMFKDLNSLEIIPTVEKSTEGLPKASFGFSSASGKKLELSETALKKAQNMFKDLDSLENVPTPEKSTGGPPDTSFGFSSASGKKLGLSETALKKAQNMFKDLDSSETVPTAEKSTGGPSETSFGFSSASGKKLGLSESALKKAQNIFKDLDSLENVPTAEKSTGGPPETSFGFSSASGKKLGLSETALKRAQNIFKDLDSSENVPTAEKSTGGLPETSFGFSNASGKKLQLSESTLKKAQNLFNDLQDIETPKTTPIYKKVSSKPTFKSPLIENPALDSNSKITPKGALSRKRSLGVSSLRNFDISEEKLKRARLIFEDIGNQNNSPKMNVFKKNLGSNESPNLAHFDTPKSSKPIGNSNFQNMDSPDPKNLQDDSKIPKADVNLEFSSKKFAVEDSDNLKDTSLNLDDFETHFLNDDFEKSPEKSFLNFSKKINSTENFEFDMAKKIEDLKSQMEILEKRMKIFKEQQEKSKENKKNTRPKPGLLFSIKTDPKNLPQRISLKNFVNDALPGTHRMKLAKNITEITPRNALNVQFWIPWDTKKLLQVPILAVKGENSEIIPTAENFIGFYEIGEAFKSMDGVNPKLISENWIENHFKWIVWKLASSERSFPKQFEKYLTPENIISQLKYRYDREIDNVQRSALKKIYEMDDSPAKRLVLCVSDIFKNGDQNFDLELTDGWYSIRTIIDSPLSKMVEKNLIKIGTKLIFYGAELQNCQGCSPLEDISGVRLKISYNSTRRAAWYVKLGYYKFQSPFSVSLKSIHHNGGLTSLTKGYIARIYPLTYMEKIFTVEKKSEEKTEIVSWHNDKAELKKIEIWERNRNSFIEKLQSQLEIEFRNDSNRKRRSSRNSKEKIENVTCPKVLYEMMENSADPEMFKEMMSPSQCRSVLDYQATVSFEKQSILNEKLKERLSEAKFDKRNVSPVLKIMLVDPNFIEHHRNLSIWYPNENYLDLKEGCVINLYNVVPRSNGQISSTKNMHIEIDKNFINGEKFKTFQRNVTPIETILEPNFKPIFNEFDTVGILINLELKENQQNFWICDEKNRYLSITILNSQENCVLLEGYKIGEIIAIQNLIYRKSNSDFGQAFGTLTTVITRKPQRTYLKNYLEDFKKKLPENLDEYVEHCQNGVEVHLAQILLEFNELQPFSFEELNSKNKEKSKKLLNSEELTLSDEEMLLIEDIV